ncbi:MAG: hypothetical protein V7K67_12605 [Nostoc sp.]|uniref:hypothetical protein n=1 Tax=Nostoc sp. TaxID=1180 RepID=UPI002FF4C915
MRLQELRLPAGYCPYGCNTVQIEQQNPDVETRFIASSLDQLSTPITLNPRVLGYKDKQIYQAIRNRGYTNFRPPTRTQRI